MIWPHCAPALVPFPLVLHFSAIAVPSALSSPRRHSNIDVPALSSGQFKNTTSVTPMFSIPRFHSSLTLCTLFSVSPLFATLTQTTPGYTPSPFLGWLNFAKSAACNCARAFLSDLTSLFRLFLASLLTSRNLIRSPIILTPRDSGTLHSTRVYTQLLGRQSHATHFT